MKKIRVGIVGYGNLGKSVEKQVRMRDDFRLVGIFSRRQVSSFFSTPCYKFEDIEKFNRKIDVMILCLGSKSDIENFAFDIAKHFNTIDSFDNHTHISVYQTKLAAQNKKNKKCSIISCGWDPGLFSLMRAQFVSICGEQQTFWGKGVSQGHSQALRELDEVDDAVEFTIPSKQAIKSALLGNAIAEKSKHMRQCYVAAKQGQNKRKLRKKICNIPDYFEGYKTKVIFCSKQKIEKLKQHMFHKGFVTTPKKQMFFELNLDSNPDFTAKVMVSYCVALSKLCKNKEYGAKTILDIPPSYLFFEQDYVHLI